MILRFKDTSGVVLFTLPNPSELEVPGPEQPIIIYDKNIDRNQVKLYVDGAEWINWTRKSMVHAQILLTIITLHIEV